MTHGKTDSHNHRRFRVKLLLLGNRVWTMIRDLRASRRHALWENISTLEDGWKGSARGQISRFRQVISPATRRKRDEANCFASSSTAPVKRDHPSGAISFHQSLISLLRVVQHLVTPGGTLTAPQEALMKTNLTQNGVHTYFLLRLSLSSPILPPLLLFLRLLSSVINSSFATLHLFTTHGEYFDEFPIIISWKPTILFVK